MAFGELLRERRRQLRLGLREFALRANMDPSDLSKIERGRTAPPRADRLDRVCAALEFGSESEECQRLKDSAAADRGEYPEDILGNEELLARLPALLRTVENKQLTDQQLDRLIEMIREA